MKHDYNLGPLLRSKFTIVGLQCSYCLQHDVKHWRQPLRISNLMISQPQSICRKSGKGVTLIDSIGTRWDSNMGHPIVPVPKAMRYQLSYPGWFLLNNFNIFFSNFLPEGRHRTSSTPISPLPLLHPNWTFEFMLRSVSETLRPFVTVISGQMTWK